MSDQTITMFAPDGSLGEIPSERVHDAMQAGGKVAAWIQAPDGSIGVVPHDKVMEAIQNKGRLMNAPDEHVKPQQGFGRVATEFGKALLNQAGGMVTGVGKAMIDPITAPQMALQMHLEDQARKAEGRSSLYRAAAIPASMVSDVSGMEQAAREGDTAGVAGRALAGGALAAAPLASGLASKALPRIQAAGAAAADIAPKAIGQAARELPVVGKALKAAGKAKAVLGEFPARYKANLDARLPKPTPPERTPLWEAAGVTPTEPAMAKTEAPSTLTSTSNRSTYPQANAARPQRIAGWQAKGVGVTEPPVDEATPSQPYTSGRTTFPSPSAPKPPRVPLWQQAGTTATEPIMAKATEAPEVTPLIPHEAVAAAASQHSSLGPEYFAKEPAKSRFNKSGAPSAAKARGAGKVEAPTAPKPPSAEQPDLTGILQQSIDAVARAKVASSNPTLPLFTDPKQFGGDITKVSNSIPASIGNKVPIGEVYDAAVKAGYKGNLEGFKLQLLAAHKNSQVSLSRADMLPLYPEVVKAAAERGAIRDQSAEFHMLDKRGGN